MNKRSCLEQDLPTEESIMGAERGKDQREKTVEKTNQTMEEYKEDLYMRETYGIGCRRMTVMSFCAINETGLNGSEYVEVCDR